ncbi:protein HEG homolog 1-like isoform X2 [Sceloporus undulatus]|uniref:protein HEG homolog 1-like isoform X2 n=1 Tax=Sceloporus undulatus TaxID=8520 RepID=UPI001C4C2150|nr:protein HEG homolog 1-like isoform X2 [Sceloporus undulatus]
MWVGLCLALAVLQGGLVASGGPGSESSTANWSTGLDLSGLSPTTWTVPPAMRETTANGMHGANGEPEAPLTCNGEDECPPWSHCEDQAGRNSCHCGLGYHLLPALGCVPARAFPARLLMLLQPPSPPEALGWWTSERPEELQGSRVAAQLQSLFQQILGHLDGYLGTSIQELKWPSLEATLMHHFSAWVLVTIQEVEVAVAAFRTRCHDNSSPLSRTPACALLRHVGTYQSLGLCDFDPCDSTSATCSSQDGLLRCTCRPGYLQVHPMDHTCAVCSSGFWLQDGTCSRCPFGFSGPGCQEPFLLALVAVSCVAGLVILLLFLLLVVFRLGRAQPSQEPHSPPQLPLHSPTLSLPRVRPPWTTMEAPVPHAGSRPAPLPQWWELDGGPRLAADTPSMKTFLGSPRRSPSAAAPQPLGGTSNFVFVGDGEEGGKRSFF